MRQGCRLMRSMHLNSHHRTHDGDAASNEHEAAAKREHGLAVGLRNRIAGCSEEREELSHTSLAA